MSSRPCADPCAETGAQIGRRLLADARVPSHPVDYYRIPRAAALCHRSPSTIKHYLTKYQLPRVKGWAVQGRARRRVTMLEPKVVALLQQLTLLGTTRAQRKRGEVLAMMAELRTEHAPSSPEAARR